MSQRYLTREQSRAVDRIAIEVYGIPGIVLMENAGRGAAELLMLRCLTRALTDGDPSPEDLATGNRSVEEGSRVVICCGKGNNGGDGFVIARHLQSSGHQPRVLLFADPAELHGDAAINFHIVQQAKVPWTRVVQDPAGRFSPEVLQSLERADWIVDALLGTGATGSVREPYAAAIRAINSSSTPVLSVDLPSGLDADSGEPLGDTVQANRTATFVAPKQGFLNRASTIWTGAVHVLPIGIPPTLWEHLF